MTDSLQFHYNEGQKNSRPNNLEREGRNQLHKTRKSYTSKNFLIPRSI